MYSKEYTEKMIYFILALCSMTVSGILAQKNCSFRDPLKDELVQVDYDPKSFQCCLMSGKQRLRNDANLELGCCGKGVYHKAFEICCNNTVINSKYGDLECCGSQLIDRTDEKQYCCNNKLHKNVGPDGMCCGNDVINRSQYKCCESPDKGNYTLLNVDDNRECCCTLKYNAEDEYCDSKRCIVHRKGYRLCNGTEFFLENNTCCDGKIIPGFSWKDHICCGQNVHNKTDGECCGSHFAPNGLSCCGNNVINSTIQRCCQGAVFNISEMKSTNVICCGKGIIDVDKEKCCGMVPYNHEVHQCCESSIEPKASNCCGSDSFFPDKQLCCRKDDLEIVINKTEPHHDRCCFHKIESCPSEPPPSRCGTQEYDPDKDLCCPPLVLPDARQRGLKCCMTTPGLAYDVEKRECYFYNNSTRLDGDDTITDPDVYSICSVCTGMWDSVTALRALDQGVIDVCKSTAMTLTVKRKRKIPRSTVIQMITERNLFNPFDILAADYRLRVLIPCRCNGFISRQRLLLLTNAKLRKLLRLGDSDVLLPYTDQIAREITKRKLMC